MTSHGDCLADVRPRMPQAYYTCYHDDAPTWAGTCDGRSVARNVISVMGPPTRPLSELHVDLAALIGQAAHQLSRSVSLAGPVSANDPTGAGIGLGLQAIT
jgi:hypothetical protein